MNRLREHRGILILVCLLAVVLGVILFSLADPGKVGTGGKIAETAVSTAEAPVTSAGNDISSYIYGLTHFRSIQKENQDLRDQISDLQSQLTDAELSSDQLAELRSMQNLLNASDFDDSYTVVTAKVSGFDDTQLFDIFTVNAGTSQGVKDGDIVLNSDGLIGHVTDVGKNWAKVISITDSDSSVSFMLSRDPATMGVISGDAEDGLTGYVFDESRSVLEGDTMVTTGMGKYPAGIRIGKITDITIDSGTDAKTVTGESFADFKALRYITILT